MFKLIDVFLAFLPDSGIVACNSGEGCELSGTGSHRHPWMALRLVVRQVDDVIVFSHNSQLSTLNSQLSPVSSYLVVAFLGCCTLLEVQASQDGILAETLLDG